MPQGSNADVLHILVGQAPKRSGVDVVLVERIGVLTQAQTLKPLAYVGHRQPPARSLHGGIRL